MPGDLLDLFGWMVGDHVAQQLERGRDVDAGGAVHPLDRRVGDVVGERRSPADRIPHAVAVRAAGLDVAHPQVTAVVDPHEQGGNGVPRGEGTVDEPVGDHDVEQAERQRQVGAGARGHPPGGVHRGRRVTGVDDHQLRSGVAGVEQESHRRHRRLGRVVAPHDDHVGPDAIGPLVGVLAEHPLVPERRVEAHVDGHVDPAVEVPGRTEQRGQSAVVAERRGPGGAGERDARRAVGVDETAEAVGDLVERVVPRHRLEPRTLGALAAPTGAAHRRGDAVGAVDPLRQRQTPHARCGVPRVRVLAGLDLDQTAVAHRAPQQRPPAAVGCAHGVHRVLGRGHRRQRTQAPGRGLDAQRYPVTSAGLPASCTSTT